MKWQELPSNGDDKPSKRTGASLDIYKDKLYLFGGRGDRLDSYYNDLYVYDLSMKSFENFL